MNARRKSQDLATFRRAPLLPSSTTRTIMLISTIKSSSSRLVASHFLRTLSTSAPAASSAAQQAALAENSHERQSKQRKPHLNKVREDGGETASLLAQAVSSTVQHRGSLPPTNNGGFNRQRRPQQQQQGERQPRSQQQQQQEGGAEGAEGARIRSRSGQLGGQLVSRRKAAGGLYDADASAISAPIAGSEVASSPRLNSNPRQQNRRGDSSRGSSPSSTPNTRRPPTSSTPRPPRKPRTQSKPVDLGAPVAPAAPPPSKVNYPSLDLASLIEQDLRNNAAALRADIGQGAEAEEGDQKARLAARREVRGDYSRWTAGATVGEGKGKHEVVQRAAGVLASNPSVSREGRDFLVGQLQGLLGAKKK